MIAAEPERLGHVYTEQSFCHSFFLIHLGVDLPLETAT
jgi:hypothetical protein